MDAGALGRRVTAAREDAGLTQASLAEAVGLDRTAITRLEAGERKISVPEMVSIAEALQRPLSFFVQGETPTVVSRRTDATAAHDTNRVLDTELDQFVGDIGTLLEMAVLSAPTPRPTPTTPKDHGAAEQLAEVARADAGLDSGPVPELGSACERLGLLTYATSMGAKGPDGGCVEVDPSRTYGAAVINGDAPPGRRRMTLAHELGHWLAGDAYDSGATGDAEKMISSFAVHFLAPRAGVTKTWNEWIGRPNRDRAIAVGATYRLSWTATTGHLRTLGLISHDERLGLDDDRPTQGDFVRLGLRWTDELGSPYLSPWFSAACVGAYVDGRLTAARTLELLRGTLTADELPKRRSAPSDLRVAFEGHRG